MLKHPKITTGLLVAGLAYKGWKAFKGSELGTALSDAMTADTQEEDTQEADGLVEPDDAEAGVGLAGEEDSEDENTQEESSWFSRLSDKFWSRVTPDVN